MSLLLDQGEINRLANQAYGTRNPLDAQELLRMLLADELKEERRKAAIEAARTPEELAIKEAKKAATAAKRAATKERKRQEKAAAQQPPNVEVVAQPVAETNSEEESVSSDDNDGEESVQPDGSDGEKSVQSHNNNDEGGSKSDDEDLFFYHSKEGQRQIKQNRKKNAKTNNKSIRKQLVQQVRKQLNEVTTVNQVVAAEAPPEPTDLVKLREAHSVLLRKGYKKLVIGVDTAVVPGSLVLLQVKSGEVDKESVALTVDDLSSKRQRFFNILVFNCSTSSISTLRVDAKHLYLAEVILTK